MLYSLPKDGSLLLSRRPQLGEYLILITLECNSSLPYKLS